MSGFADDEAGDEDVTLEISTRCGPVYNYSAQVEGDGDPGGLQCSAHPDEFCFLCAFSHYSEATDPGEEDAVAGIQNLITRLADDGHDIADVVSAVSRQYNRNIKCDVEYTNPRTKEVTKGPKWLRSSIQRHIVFSSRWPTLFHSIQTNTLRGILTIEASKLIDLDTGDIVEPNKDAYFKTIDKYGNWIKILSAIEKAKLQAAPKRSIQHGDADTDGSYYRGPKITKPGRGGVGNAAKHSRSRSRSRSRTAPPARPGNARARSYSATPGVMSPAVEI